MVASILKLINYLDDWGYPHDFWNLWSYNKSPFNIIQTDFQGCSNLRYVNDCHKKCEIGWFCPVIFDQFPERYLGPGFSPLPIPDAKPKPCSSVGQSTNVDGSVVSMANHGLCPPMPIFKKQTSSIRRRLKPDFRYDFPIPQFTIPDHQK